MAFSVGISELVLIAVVLAIAIAAVVAAYRVASSKGRNGVLWAALTMVFLPILLIVLLLPPTSEP